MVQLLYALSLFAMANVPVALTQQLSKPEVQTFGSKNVGPPLSFSVNAFPLSGTSEGSNVNLYTDFDESIDEFLGPGSSDKANMFASTSRLRGTIIDGSGRIIGSPFTIANYVPSSGRRRPTEEERLTALKIAATLHPLRGSTPVGKGTALPDGGFAVAYNCEPVGPLPTSVEDLLNITAQQASELGLMDICVRSYDSRGRPSLARTVVSPIQQTFLQEVSDDTDSFLYFRRASPSITLCPDGNLAVAWQAFPVPLNLTGILSGVDLTGALRLVNSSSTVQIQKLTLSGARVGPISTLEGSPFAAAVSDELGTFGGLLALGGSSSALTQLNQAALQIQALENGNIAVLGLARVGTTSTNPVIKVATYDSRLTLLSEEVLPPPQSVLTSTPTFASLTRLPGSSNFAVSYSYLRFNPRIIALLDSDGDRYAVEGRLGRTLRNLRKANTATGTGSRSEIGRKLGQRRDLQSSGNRHLRTSPRRSLEGELLSESPSQQAELSSILQFEGVGLVQIVNGVNGALLGQAEQVAQSAPQRFLQNLQLEPIQNQANEFLIVTEQRLPTLLVSLGVPGGQGFEFGNPSGDAQELLTDLFGEAPVSQVSVQQFTISLASVTPSSESAIIKSSSDFAQSQDLTGVVSLADPGEYALTFTNLDASPFVSLQTRMQALSIPFQFTTPQPAVTGEPDDGGPSITQVCATLGRRACRQNELCRLESGDCVPASFIIGN